MRLRDLGLSRGRMAFWGFVLLLVLINARNAAHRMVEAARRWLPGASSGSMVQASRARLARADDEVARAAARVVAVAQSADSARSESGRSLRVVQEQRRRVRVLSPMTLAVAVTPGAPPSTVEVPRPVVERLYADSSAISALVNVVQWQDTLVGAQQARIAADSSARESARRLTDALEADHRRRCGFRCGVVVGVAAVVATRVALGSAPVRLP